MFLVASTIPKMELRTEYKINNVRSRIGRVLVCHFAMPPPPANSANSEDIAASHGTIKKPPSCLNQITIGSNKEDRALVIVILLHYLEQR